MKIIIGLSLSTAILAIITAITAIVLSGCGTKFVQKSHTEIITLEDDIIIVGLSLQKSGLPTNDYDSVWGLWNIYNNVEYKNNIENLKTPNLNYVVYSDFMGANFEYIAGNAVAEVGLLDDKSTSFVIPAGKYVRDNFNAETFEILTTKTVWDRHSIVRNWAIQNNIEIDIEFGVEVYSQKENGEPSNEAYTLYPIKER